MVIYEVIALTHKNLKPNPTSPDRQLSLTINRLAAGCTLFDWQFKYFPLLWMRHSSTNNKSRERCLRIIYNDKK